MKKILLPFFAGMAGAAVATSLVSPSYATVDAEKINEALSTGMCQVDVGSGFMTGGTRCFRGEVMTGFLNNNLLCARINVTCN